MSRGIIGVLVLLATGLGEIYADSSNYINFKQPQLIQGKQLWLQNCEGCHGYGYAGAPIPMSPDDWIPRLKQSRVVLYDHAINGFFGEDDSMMPERGGNPDLTDQQVQAAVDYMIALAEFYIKRKVEEE